MHEDDKLVGAYGVHVDDCAAGGEGSKYGNALEDLKKPVEFRNWRVYDGDSCRSRYVQFSAKDFSITMTQERFAKNLRPLRLSRPRLLSKESLPEPGEVKCLRANNGGLNRKLVKHAVQAGLVQPNAVFSTSLPVSCDAVLANNAISRAKQHAQLALVFPCISPEHLAIM